MTEAHAISTDVLNPMGTTNPTASSASCNADSLSESLIHFHVSTATADDESSEVQSTLTMQQVDSDRVFHLFPKLPSELRLKIWEVARPAARVVNIHREISVWGGQEYPFARSSAKVPSLLHANFESRQVALQWYTRSFMKGPPTFHRNIYFDHSRDWAYFSCDDCDGRGCDIVLDQTTTCGLWFSHYYPWSRRLKPVIYQFDHDGPDLMSFKVKCFWTVFKHVHEAMWVHRTKGLGSRSEAKFKGAEVQHSVPGCTSPMDVYKRYVHRFSRYNNKSIGNLKKLTFVEFEEKTSSVGTGNLVGETQEVVETGWRLSIQRGLG